MNKENKRLIYNLIDIFKGLQLLGFKYIAMDKPPSGYLVYSIIYIYDSKPTFIDGYWISEDSDPVDFGDLNLSMDVNDDIEKLLYPNKCINIDKIINQYNC